MNPYDQDTPLFTSSCAMSKEAYVSMNYELHGNALKLSEAIVALIMIIIGDAFLLSKNSIAGIVFIILEIFVSKLTGVLYTNAVKRNYRSSTI